MFYGATNKATGFKEKDFNGWKVKLIYALLFFVPRANPDFEKLFPKVSTWLIEVNDNGEANREVALDENGNPLFAAPDNRNFGLWTDSPDVLTKDTLEPIEKSYFEEMWQKIARDA